MKALINPRWRDLDEMDIDYAICIENVRILSKPLLYVFYHVDEGFGAVHLPSGWDIVTPL